APGRRRGLSRCGPTRRGPGTGTHDRSRACHVSVWARGPIVVGHRGGRGDGWPCENSLPAFERARREGALAIELDVRTCADGNVVVFHDTTLSRTADGRDERRVADVSAEELGSMGVPRLEEALS